MNINIYVDVAIAFCTLVLGIVIGMIYRKIVAEGKLGAAEKQADEIIKKAEKEADTKKKEAVLAAKEELHKGRAELDREIKDRRNELSRQERRIEQKENNLDKQTDALDKKEEKLTKILANPYSRAKIFLFAKNRADNTRVYFSVLVL